MNIEAGLQRFPFINVVDALVRRHTPLRKAVRAVERAMEAGFAIIEVPMIEDAAALIADLASCQVRATVSEPQKDNRDAIDVAEIREGFKLTQEEFAEAFDLDLATLRGWEQGRREPDRATKAYLQVIAAEPEMVVGILHKKRLVAAAAQ